MPDLLLIAIPIASLIAIGYYWGSKTGRKKLAEAIKKEQYNKAFSAELNQKDAELFKKEELIQVVKEKNEILSAQISSFPIIAEIVASIEEKRFTVAQEYLTSKHSIQAARVVGNLEYLVKRYSAAATTYRQQLLVYEQLFAPIINSIQDIKLSDLNTENTSQIQELSKIFLLIQQEKEKLKSDKDAYNQYIQQEKEKLESDKENYKLFRRNKYIEMNKKLWECKLDCQQKKLE